MINLGAKAGDVTTKVLNSYDLIAIKPSTQTEQVFEQICSKSDCDIIQVDCAARMNFYIQKTWIKLAQQRSIQFEITYGSSCLEGGALARR